MLKKIIIICVSVFMLSGCSANSENIDVEKTNEPVQTQGILSTATPEPVFQENDRFVIMCEEFLNLRGEPNSESEILGKALKGESVKVLGYENKFAHIEFDDGRTGYVLAGYLKNENPYPFECVTLQDKYSYDTMIADANRLIGKYPGKVSLDVAGKSEQGRDIIVLIIGNENAEKKIFVQGAIHAREYMTSMLMMAQAEYYARNQFDDDFCVYMMPMLNPDGVMISIGGTVTDDITKIYKEDKDRGYVDSDDYTYVSGWKANINGVDLNRNFDAMWEKINTRETISSYNYRGKNPESEAETRAVVEYTKTHFFDATISYHASGSLIYYEFGEASQTNEKSKELAKAISEVTNYSIHGDDGTSFGGYKDWAIMKMQIPSVTVEIGTRICPLPETEFYTIFERNKKVIISVENWLKNS